MGIRKTLKIATGTALTALFAGFSAPAFAQAQPPDSLSAQSPPKEITLNPVENNSRRAVRGPARLRPIDAHYVREIGVTEPLDAENAHAIVHIASISKMIVVGAFYHCWDIARQEAANEDALKSINSRFQDKENKLINPALVYSDNLHAEWLGMFLESLDLEFIRQGMHEQKLSRGNLRVFSKIIIPHFMKEIGAENTVLYTASGLPPYAGEYSWPSWRAYRPSNYKNSRSSSYNDPTDYNHSTPADLAKVFEYILVKYPQILKPMQILAFNNVMNTNHLLETAEGPDAKPVKGVLGGKSGTTNGAGASKVTYAKRNGVGIVVVDMGHKDRSEVEDHTIELVETAFRKLEPKLKENIRRDSMRMIEAFARAQDSLRLAKEQHVADSMAYVDFLRAQFAKEQEGKQLTLKDVDSVLHTIDSMLQVLMKEDMDIKNQKKKEKLIRYMDRYKELIKQDSLRVQGTPRKEPELSLDN